MPVESATVESATLGAIAFLMTTLARLCPRLRCALPRWRAGAFLPRRWAGAFLRRTCARLLHSRLFAALFHARLFARALFHAGLFAFPRPLDARLLGAALLADAIHAPLALVVALDLPRGGFTHRIL